MKKKRLLRSAILLAIWFIVPWSALSAAVSLKESFDSEIPLTWRNESNDPNALWEYSDAGYGGGCALLGYKTTAIGSDAVEARLTAPAIIPQKKTKLNFKYINRSVLGGSLAVLLKVEGSSAYDTLSAALPEVREWLDMSFPLQKYAGKRISISFVGKCQAVAESSAVDVAVDNVSVMEPPMCPQPTDLNVQQLTQTSASLNWSLGDADAMPSQYDLTVTDMSDGTVVIREKELMVASTSTMLENLRPGVTYSVLLRSDCNESYKGYSEMAEPFSFTTLIEPVKLEYNQDFDRYSVLPSGWSAMGDVRVTGKKHYGDAGKALMLTADAGSQAAAISPQIDHVAADMQFTAFVAADEKVKFQIALTNDVTDMSVFDPVHYDSVDVADGWKEIRFNTAKYDIYPDDKNLSFVILLPAGAKSVLYVDGINIIKTPACPRPENLMAYDADSNSVYLAWRGTDGVNNHEARFTPVGGGDAVVKPFTGNPARVGGLLHNTEYTVEVRDVCKAGDNSDWSLPVQFATLCGTTPTTLQTFNFDDNAIPQCWFQKTINKGDGDGTDYGNETWTVYDSKANSGNYSLTFRYTHTKARILLVSQPVYIDKAKAYDLSFYFYRNSGPYFPNEGIAVWINNRPDTVGGKKMEFLPGSRLFAPVEVAEGWYKYDYNIDLKGAVYFIFEGISQHDKDQYIDDVAIVPAPSCRKLKATSAEYTDPTDDIRTMSMDWEASGSEKEWDIRYNMTWGTGSKADTVSAKNKPHYVFTDLVGGETYTVEGTMAAVCGKGDTSEYVRFEHKFYVPCAAGLTVPFTEKFETQNRIPACWHQQQTVLGSGFGNDWGDECWNTIEETTLASSGSRMIEMSKLKEGAHSILVTPQFTVPETGEYVVSLYMYREASPNIDDSKKGDGLQVWINSRPDTVGGTKLMFVHNAMELSPVEAAEGIYEYYADIPVRGKQYLVLEGISYWVSTIRIDDVSVRPKPDCMSLKGGVSVDSVAHDAVKLSISENTAWEIECCEAGAAQGTGKKFSSDGGPIVITGLDPDMYYKYDVYKRRVCGGSKHSEWNKNVISFHTLCVPDEVTADAEFLDGFEDLEIGMLLDSCYFDVVETGYDKFAADDEDIYYGYFYPKDGKRFILRRSNGTYSWVFRALKLRKDVNYEMSGYFQQGTTDSRNASVTMAVATQPEVEFILSYPAKEISFVKEWKFINGYFSVPADGIYYVGFYINHVKDRYSAHAIDNFRVREVKCAPPTVIDITALDSDSAVFTWVSDAASWEMKVSSNNDFDVAADLVFNSPVDKKTITIKGLKPNVQYFYTVRSKCDESTYSDWSYPVSFTTHCMDFELPLEEDFEDETLADFGCWSVLGDDAAYSRSTAVAHEGIASLEIKKAVFASPKLKAETLKDCMLNGWVRSQNVDSVKFTISLTSNPDDPTMSGLVSTVTVPKQGEWQEFAAYFESAFDDPVLAMYPPKYVVIQMQGDATLCFDDLYINKASACRKPSQMQISDVTYESFKLVWNANGNETKWLVRVLNGDKLALDTVVDKNPSVITGLKPLTAYKVEMAAVCGENANSDTVQCGSFATPCGLYAITYDLLLDAGEDKSLPDCWYLGEGNTDLGSSNWNIYEDYSTGTLSLKYSAYTSYDKVHRYQQLVTPTFDLRKETGASMYATICNSASSDTLVIRVSTDGGATFPTVIAEIMPDGDTIDVRYDLSLFTGSPVAVAFEAHGGPSYGSRVDIYGFGIEAESACRRPEGIETIEIGDTRVSLAVNDPDESHTAWQLVYGKKGFDHNAATPKEITARRFMVDGLEPLTQYDVYVRTVCSAGSTSDWRGPFRLTTACPSEIPVPFKESFEYKRVSDFCFDVVNLRTDNESSGWYEYLYPDVDLEEYSKTDGDMSLKMTSSDEEPLFVVFQPMAKPINTIQVKFDYQCQGDDSKLKLVLGVMTDVDDFASFVPVQEYSGAAQFTSAVCHFNAYPQAMEKGACIAFKLTPTAKSGQTVYIDNVRFDEDSACPWISRSEVTKVTGTTATIAAEFIAEKVECVYGPAGTAADKCEKSMIVDKPEFDITGLVEGKTYYVYLRSVCGEEKGLWTSPVVVATECGVKTLAKGTQWKETFDTYGNETFPACFTPVITAAADNKAYPAIEAQGATDKQGLRMVGATQVALPEFDADANKLMLSFDAAIEKERLEVLVKEDLLPETQGVSVADLASYDDGRIVIDLSAYDAKGKYIVFATPAGADVTVDSLVVEWAPACFAPRNVKVLAGDVVATILWTAAPDATLYEYELLKDGETAPIKTGTVTEARIDLTGLTKTTGYEIKIRTVCGGETVPADDWVTEKFTTLLNTTPMPFVTGFENDADNAKWQYAHEEDWMGELVVNQFAVGSATAAVKAGTKALYISKDGGVTYEYDNGESAYGQHAFRTLYFEPGYYYCKYSWKCAGESSYDAAALHLAPAGLEIEAGNSIDADAEGVIALKPLMSQSDKWNDENIEFIVDEAGYYNLVLSWSNDFSGGAQPPVSIDDLEINAVPCVVLQSAELHSVTTNSAAVVVDNVNKEGSVQYSLYLGGEKIATDIVNSDTVKLDNLKPNKQYRLAVRAYCDADSRSDSIVVDFTTLCEIISLTDGKYTDSFEEYTEDNSPLSQCWDATADFAVRTTTGGEASQPVTGNNYVTLGYNKSGYMTTDFNLEGGSYYTISVMARQNAAEGCTLRIVNRADETLRVLKTEPIGNTGWVKVEGDIYIAEAGIYSFGIDASLNDKPDYLCLDDFTVEKTAFGTPTNLIVVATGTDNATFSWTGYSDSYQLQVLDSQTEDVLKDVNGITDETVKVDGLNANSKYIARVRAVSGDKTSEWISAEFDTECNAVAIPYGEDFDNLEVNALPQCWDNTSASDNIKKNWNVMSDGTNKHLALPVSAVAGHAEVWSPVLNITDASARVTFSYVNTSLYDTLVVKIVKVGENPTSETIVKAATTLEPQLVEYPMSNFMGSDVVIAFSSNATRKSKNNYIAIDNFSVACLDADKPVYDSVCVDMPYIRKGYTVPSADLKENGTHKYRRLIKADGEGCDYYEVLNLYVRRGGVTNIVDTICEGAVYKTPMFPKGITEEGQYSNHMLSSEGCDSTVNLTLVVQNPFAVLFDTICEANLPYTFNGMECDSTGTYVDTVPNPTTVCDSIVTLHLTVLPTNFVVNKTVCAGETFPWHDYFGNDTLLTTTGQYVHKYKNYRGCDSIEVMNFTVLPDYVSIDSTICFGQSVLHGGEIYKTTGVYPVTLENELRCKYTSELHLTVIAPDTASFDDISCEGREYFGNGFQDITINSDTVLLRNESDAEGCISVTRVNVDFIPTVEVFDTVEIGVGGSYDFCGNSYNEPGTYTCKKQSTVTGCDSITHLTLVVSTGLDYSSVMSLTIAPNPISADDNTFVHRTWTADEQNGLTVEIINSVGQVLSSEKPEYYPIVIRPLRASGVYYVRITSGTGNVYMGKLVVK